MTSSLDCCDAVQTVGRSITGVGNDGVRKSRAPDRFLDGLAPRGSEVTFWSSTATTTEQHLQHVAGIAGRRWWRHCRPLTASAVVLQHFGHDFLGPRP